MRGKKEEEEEKKANSPFIPNSITFPTSAWWKIKTACAFHKHDIERTQNKILSFERRKIFSKLKRKTVVRKHRPFFAARMKAVGRMLNTQCSSKYIEK